MKKVLFLISFLIVSITSFSVSVEIKGGIDFGEKNYDSKKFDIDSGYKMDISALKGKKFQLGLGTGYHQLGDIDLSNSDYDGDDYFSAQTIYLAAKYNFKKKRFNPFLRVNAGIALNKKGTYFDSLEKNLENLQISKGYDEANINIDINTGIYLAVGAGIEYKNFILELIYESINASVDASGNVKYNNTSTALKVNAEDININTLTIELGYKFGKGNK